MLAFRFRVYGTENIPDKGPFILVCNHQSYLDPMFCGVGCRRRLCYVARESLFVNKFFGALIASGGAIPVRPNQANLAAMREVMSRLRKGLGACLYPEATRTSDGRIEDFKAGFGLLSRKTGAPIVPVLLDGAFECWPRQNKMFSHGGVTVCYGRAITAEETKGMGDRELAEVVTDRLRRMQHQWRLKQGKEPFGYELYPSRVVNIRE